MKIIVFLLGIIGSGKGTQAEKIAREFDLEQVMTSRIVKEKMKSGVKDPEIDMEEERRRYYSGQLNSSHAISKWVSDKMKELHSRGRGIVFDGSPRTLSEAKTITALADKLYGAQNVFPIEIQLSKKAALNRLQHRRICEKCGRSVPWTKETKDLTHCPYSDCGGKLIRRELDNPETIKVRLRDFENLTKPAINYYRKNGRLYEIDGNKSIDEVFSQIKELINRKLKNGN